jgi:carnitine O-acetyltransferase
MTRTIASSAPRKSTPIPERYSVDPNVGPMLAFQRSLPRLPVPTIESTTSKYLETVKPHLTPEAFTRTKIAVEEFARSDLARALQKRLQTRAAGRTNWLADWWNETAYMGYRGA